MLVGVIELFDMAPGEEEAFRTAWVAEAPAGAVLYRALREDARYRFASVVGGPTRGVVLITDAVGSLESFAGRQGFLSAVVDGELAVVHWSSPLMYFRTGVALPGGL